MKLYIHEGKEYGSSLNSSSYFFPFYVFTMAKLMLGWCTHPLAAVLVGGMCFSCNVYATAPQEEHSYLVVVRVAISRLSLLYSQP